MLTSSLQGKAGSTALWMNQPCHVDGGGHAAGHHKSWNSFQKSSTSNPPHPLVQHSKQGCCPPLERGSWTSCPLTAVTFIAVVSTVILKVTFVGEWDTGPRLLTTELGVQIDLSHYFQSFLWLSSPKRVPDRVYTTLHCLLRENLCGWTMIEKVFSYPLQLSRKEGRGYKNHFVTTENMIQLLSNIKATQVLKGMFFLLPMTINHENREKQMLW